MLYKWIILAFPLDPSSTVIVLKDSKILYFDFYQALVALICEPITHYPAENYRIARIFESVDEFDPSKVAFSFIKWLN
jgi:hypothetical protein